MSNTITEISNSKRMVKSSDKDQVRKKITESKTFLVPFALEETKENITISTNDPSKTSQEQIINQAIQFHLKGNIAEATKCYKQLISQRCNDHRVFSNYGIILKNLGNLKEAEIYYRKAIELNPNFANAYSNLGLILKNLGNLKEAELSTRKAIELNPNFADAHSNLGLILKNLGNLKEAESSTRKAIELNPNFADAYFNLGYILIDLGNLKEAELSTRKAIELNPNFANAYSNLGSILKDLGKSQEAELSIRKAIGLNPDLASAYFNLGEILEENGKREEAIENWEKAIKLEPQSETAITSLAHHLCFEKKYELALKYLSKNKSNASQILYLGCLLSLDREKEFNEKFQELSKKKICNAHIGGIVEHANIIYEKRYESPFCNKAKKYVLIDKINEESFSQNDLNELILYTQNSQTRMRAQATLKGGDQTSGNLFSLNLTFVKSIKKALEEKIEVYKNKFKDSGEGFIKYWPADYELRSWMINMRSGGFLKPHNHEYGWITGSFYLQLPKVSNNKDSGNLAFSYQGPRYPKRNKNFHITIQKIETRDICIFPSSLFHHTIPFKSSEERICFVFDLVQK